MTVQLEPKLEVTSSVYHRPPTRAAVNKGFETLWDNRHLASIMIRRDLLGKYRGSLLGVLWPVINPLGHLLLYTFVFSVVLKVRFGHDPSTSNFALYLMTGLLPWGALSESLSRATTCVLEVPNLVKRVVFPLEILPCTIAVSSLLSQLIGMAILLVVATFYLGTVHWTVIFLPLILVSQTLFIAGCCWLLAGIGVFIQDMRHFISLGLSIWMYTTPLVYPASSFPPQFKFLSWVNPMAGILGDYRRVILQGVPPDWYNFCFYTTVGIIFWFAGFYFFSKTKQSFADVI